MDWSDVIGFAAIASLMVVLPGPNFLLIVQRVPMAGRLVGFASIAGFATAFLVHGTLSIFGLSLLIANSEPTFLTLVLLGAIYLCWIGWRSVSSYQYAIPLPTVDLMRGSASTAQPGDMTRGFVDGLITNLLNPKNAVFYVAAFPQYLDPSSLMWMDGYALVVIHILANALWYGAVVICLERALHSLGKRRVRCSMQLVSGCAMMALGGVFAVSALLNALGGTGPDSSVYRFTNSASFALSAVYHWPRSPALSLSCFAESPAC